MFASTIVNGTSLFTQIVLTKAEVPRLCDIGVAREVLPEVAGYAMDDWSLARVPRCAGSDLREPCRQGGGPGRKFAENDQMVTQFFQ